MNVPNEAVVSEVLERELGVVVHAVKRQIRWRPCWFVDAERDGEPLRLVVRGDRVDTCIQPLCKEVAFHRLLEEAGIPVPKILGWLDALGAVALEHVPGQDHFFGVDHGVRDRVVDQYLQQLARLHALDVAPFSEAGLLRAADPEDSGRVFYDTLERIWRGKKRSPNPWMEFALGWLHRHPPRSHGREAPIVWDSGQLHHHEGQLLALMDLECGHVGDPMADLAVWRMRGAHVPFGDFRKLYARYEELSGTPIDLEAIQRQAFAAAMSNELMFGPGVEDPVPGMDLMNTMQWTNATNLYAIEALGEILDIDLPGIDVPEASRGASTRTFEHLAEQLRGLRSDDPLLMNELRIAFRTVRHLARVDEIGEALLQDDLDDLHRLLGRRPESAAEGDVALERFVLADAREGRHDEALARLFHRRILRIHVQMGPLGSKMVAHAPAQRFDGAPPRTRAVFDARE